MPNLQIDHYTINMCIMYTTVFIPVFSKEKINSALIVTFVLVVAYLQLLYIHTFFLIVGPNLWTNGGLAYKSK